MRIVPNTRSASARANSKLSVRVVAALLLLLHAASPGVAGAYVLNSVVADMRDPSSISGGTACPQLTRFNAALSGGISRQWSTSLSANPVTLFTASQTPAGQLAEIAAVITQSFATWTGVVGSALTSASLGTLQQTSAADACAADGVNTICFNQSDAGFTTGVLAFTRVFTADSIGQQVAPAAPPSAFVGQILDADILVRPADPTATFATPAALAANPTAYDLESILTHEMGHLLGFGHSGVWRAMMFPFAPPQGSFLGSRPTSQSPDAPLGDDDRAAVRALYHNPSDATYIGSVAGRILPANPLVLSGDFSGEGQPVTGIFAAQVVAVNSATGAVAGAALSGWSCADPGPPVFDGAYRIAGLAVGPQQSYQVYAEPLDGPLSPENALQQTTLCRNALTDPGWPAQFSCVTPAPVANFSARIRPAP